MRAAGELYRALLLGASAFAPAAALALALALGPGSGQAVAKPKTAEFRLRVRQIIMQMQKEAIERVSLVMEDVATWMESYCRENDHFPSDDLESQWARTNLSRLMPANPYNPSAAPTDRDGQQIPVSADQRMKVNVQVDRGLELSSLKAAQDTPPDGWQAPAGTVTVLSDGYHLACIWAAGADQRPIRDPQSGKARVIIARCGR